MRGGTLQTQHNEKYTKHYISLAWASSVEDWRTDININITRRQIDIKSPGTPFAYFWCRDQDLVAPD